MHCLYCDRPLALLKRLTGDGEFCSKEHRKIYQREHSQLALARLLEAQSKGGATGRPDRDPAGNPAPEIKNKITAREESHPKNAGFVADAPEASAASEVAKPGSLPRFELGSPVWGGAGPAARGERSGPRPKTARFLASEHPQPRAAESPAKREENYSFKPPARSLRLSEASPAAQTVAPRLRPIEGGFLFHSLEASDAPAKASLPAQPCFAPRPHPIPGPHDGAGGAAKVGMRPARFLSAAPLCGAWAGGKERGASIRQAGIAPRWKPLEPAMPERQPGKITLVLGAFLGRPVRPASQERLSEALEIRFAPVAFPIYSPRMGCLEERLHRTDRIGFSPP